MDVWGQSPFPCRLLWGIEGAALAGDRGDIVVVVDVFSFSSAVAVATHRGAEVLPAGSPEEAGRLAAAMPGAAVLPGPSRPTPEGWSHSPRALSRVPAGQRFVYFSPNGGRCCARAAGAAVLLAGSLLNASAVAAAAREWHRRLGAPVTVVACGEGWDGSGALRPCLEDELGAGAVVAAMGLATSPEATAGGRTFDALRASLGDLLWDCASGREWRARGFPEDVRAMARLDAVPTVPTRAPDGWLRAAPVPAP